MSRAQVARTMRLVTGELRNFQDIANYILPRPEEIPALAGIDVYGATIPLNGVFGGDHIIFIDFKKRFDLQARIQQAAAEGRIDVLKNLEDCGRKAGIAILDVAGHHATDALLAGMLHQAFLLGSIYELDISGKVTKRLFENINTRFYNSSRRQKFVTMLYGEMSEDATFSFLSAGHPPPIVFSCEHNRFMEVSSALCTAFPPIGTLPSNDNIDRSSITSVLGFKDRYRFNEWKLMGTGDIMLLYTDGLLEHAKDEQQYLPQHLEQKIRDVKHESAQEIFYALKQDFLRFAEPSDDISLVVIKRT
jgi:serine phosphatase RsbU (regulator of sigma subunit)